LPALREGIISKGEAARRLGISHRSLNRYLRQSAGMKSVGQVGPDNAGAGMVGRVARLIRSRALALGHRFAGLLGDAGAKKKHS